MTEVTYSKDPMTGATIVQGAMYVTPKGRNHILIEEVRGNCLTCGVSLIRKVRQRTPSCFNCHRNRRKAAAKEAKATKHHTPRAKAKPTPNPKKLSWKKPHRIMY